MRFSALCRRAALAHALPSAAALAQSSGPAGCTTGPASSCIDPVPATFLSGSWIQDDSASEWTLVANNGAPMTFGQVSGTVIVFPPDPNCPTVSYSVDPVSSNYSPSAISYPTEGSTTFQWKAVNPNPSGTCDTFTPVAWMVFQGTIPNKGNDTGSGTWNNSDQKSGPLAIETNLVITPSGENVAIDPANGGWGTGVYQTEAQFLQTLMDTKSSDPSDPNKNKFQGRQVYEQANGLASDQCYNAAVNEGLNNNPTPPFAILGSVWNVGLSAGNQYGDDSVGWTTQSIDWYRSHLAPSAFPCTAIAPQAMLIVNNISGYGDSQYATHTLAVTIDYPHGVLVSKDSLSEQSSY